MNQRTPALACSDTHQTPELDLSSFDALLERWNDHQRLRRNGAPLAALMDSRLALDAARLAAHIDLAA